MTESFQKEGGSFRDPSGYIFRYRDEVYRCLDESTWLLMEKMRQGHVLEDLTRKGLVVATRPVEEGSALHGELSCRYYAETRSTARVEL
jgi:hypothetical protein